MWPDNVLRPVFFSAPEHIRSYFGALEIAGITGEIMGDVQHRLPGDAWGDPLDIMAKHAWLEVDGMRLSHLSLLYEAEAYSRLGRQRVINGA